MDTVDYGLYGSEIPRDGGLQNFFGDRSRQSYALRQMLLRTATLAVAGALCLLLPGRALALGEPQHVSFTAGPGAFPLASQGHITPLCIDAADWPGVLRAATSFSSDIHSVTGDSPAILHTPGHESNIVLIGTIGHSPLIDRLIATHKLDVSAIRGHWEMSVTKIVEHPLPGVARALVIAGADKRGTIFGIYDLSEQIGVSPWYWWADVPIPHHDALFVTPGTYVQPEPAVKYRGIFFNDEAPALSGWTTEKFGGMNHQFYEHVFELLLRLKANFLWPAMWNNAFPTDDPLNAKLADEYGIVMGTSHEEPMMRAEKEWTHAGLGPWNYSTNSKNIDEYWRAGMERDKNYEEVVTLGMRGLNDTPMSNTEGSKQLEAIVAKQREILKQTVNPDITKVPQVWALYKEVQNYYDSGMRVPDDVTLLWCGDNWGDLRRLPTAAERKRSGGAGIYYHFDYVGDPRNYKWLNTTSITKVWEQMNLAWRYGADRLWVVNVGDLKPMEFPISFFLAMGRTPDQWGAAPDDKASLADFTRAWCAENFGPEHANEIADLITGYTKLNTRRKPELLEPTTFSLTVDHEADRVDAEWRDLTARAERVNDELPEAYRPAFFELVLYPLKASAVVNEMYIDAGRANLFAEEGRASANFYAAETHRLFAEDATLSSDYNHKLLNGKWDHMMDQTHIGYIWWQEPPLNAMPAVTEVQPLAVARMVVIPEGSAPIHGAGRQLRLPVFDPGNHPTRTITIANSGVVPFHYTATASAPWIHLSAASGEVAGAQTPAEGDSFPIVNPGPRIDVSIDWAAAPAADATGTITLTQEGATNQPPVKVAVSTVMPAPGTHLSGFIEEDGAVTMQAEHATSNHAANGVAWRVIPGFGETLSGMEAFPVLAPSTLEAGDQACLAYDFSVYTTAPRSLQSILAPTLSFQPGHGLRYSVAVDAEKPILVDAWASNTREDWSKAVSDGVHKVDTSLGTLSAGTHTLHLCRVDPGVVLEKLIVFTGEHAPATYLGPPESAFIPASGAAAASAAAQESTR
jgi:hypothetical protein